jgi:hypothetical protein
MTPLSPLPGSWKGGKDCKVQTPTFNLSRHKVPREPQGEGLGEYYLPIPAYQPQGQQRGGGLVPVFLQAIHGKEGTNGAPCTSNSDNV